MLLLIGATFILSALITAIISVFPFQVQKTNISCSNTDSQVTGTKFCVSIVQEKYFLRPSAVYFFISPTENSSYGMPITYPEPYNTNPTEGNVVFWSEGGVTIKTAGEVQVAIRREVYERGR